MSPFNEAGLEEAVKEWFEELGYIPVFGPDISPDANGSIPERLTYSDVILKERLKDAIYRINEDITDEILEETVKKVETNSSPSLIVNNKKFHEQITERSE